MTGASASAVAVATGDVREEARLHAVRELGVLDTPPEDRFDRITRLAQRLFGVRSALVTVIDDERQWFKSRQGFSPTETPRAHAFCDVAIRSPRTLVVEDARSDDRFSGNPLVTGEPHIRFYAGRPLHAPGGHRIGTLCIFDDAPRELAPAEQETLEDLADAVQRELLLRDEFDRAADVQRSLLPRHAPDLPGYEVAGLCAPARAVAGDFYDWHLVEPDRLGITIADVMGKGIAAALLMATVRAVLRATGREPDPAAALSAAAATLSEDLDETGAFVTLVHTRLCPATGIVQHLDAGHGLTFHVRRGEDVSRIASNGLPLGTLPDVDWEVTTVPLEPGDLLVSVSDGFLDLYGDVNEGIHAFMALARSATGAQDFVDRLASSTRGRALPDDVTAVALHRTTA